MSLMSDVFDVFDVGLCLQTCTSFDTCLFLIYSPSLRTRVDTQLSLTLFTLMTITPSYNVSHQYVSHCLSHSTLAYLILHLPWYQRDWHFSLHFSERKMRQKQFYSIHCETSLHLPFCTCTSTDTDITRHYETLLDITRHYSTFTLISLLSVQLALFRL